MSVKDRIIRLEERRSASAPDADLTDPERSWSLLQDLCTVADALKASVSAVPEWLAQSISRLENGPLCAVSLQRRTRLQADAEKRSSRYAAFSDADLLKQLEACLRGYEFGGQQP
jgi:hypothetical protein